MMGNLSKMYPPELAAFNPMSGKINQMSKGANRGVRLSRSTSHAPKSAMTRGKPDFRGIGKNKEESQLTMRLQLTGQGTNYCPGIQRAPAIADRHSDDVLLLPHNVHHIRLLLG